jgi:antitoxin Phd
MNMKVNTESMVSITEANQNFSRVARMVDEQGSVIILKNNTPRYLIIEFTNAESEQTMSNEDVLSVSRRIMKKNKVAYEVLSK